MVRDLLLCISLFVAGVAVSQTPTGSFECHIHAGAQAYTPAQIDAFISRVSFEKYRLASSPTTLTFDNGFDVVLLSAAEAQHQGLIKDATGYPVAFPRDFRMPVFHLAPNGAIGAGYSKISKKHSAK